MRAWFYISVYPLEFQESHERQLKAWPEYRGHGKLENIEGVQRLAEILQFVREAGSIFISAVTELSAEEQRDIRLWELGSLEYSRLPLSAWEVNAEEVMETAPRVDKGGWASIALPTGFIYKTKSRQAKPLACLVDDFGEFAVSQEMLDRLQAIEPRVKGVPVFPNRKRQESVPGVWQLAIDSYAPPRVPSWAILQTEGEETALSYSVLPTDALRVPTKLMRSAEPWLPQMLPAWIIDSDVKAAIEDVTQHAAFSPVLIEGTDLHRKFEDLWKAARHTVDRLDNAEWGAA